jgi:hypothetical protein
MFKISLLRRNRHLLQAPNVKLFGQLRFFSVRALELSPVCFSNSSQSCLRGLRTRDCPRPIRTVLLPSGQFGLSCFTLTKFLPFKSARREANSRATPRRGKPLLQILQPSGDGVWGITHNAPADPLFSDLTKNRARRSRPRSHVPVHAGRAATSRLRMLHAIPALSSSVQLLRFPRLFPEQSLRFCLWLPRIPSVSSTSIHVAR